MVWACHMRGTRNVEVGGGHGDSGKEAGVETQKNVKEDSAAGHKDVGS